MTITRRFLSLLLIVLTAIAPIRAYASTGWGPWAAGGGSNSWFSGLGVGSVVTGIGVGTMLGGTSDVTPIALDPHAIALPSGWSRDSSGYPVPPPTTAIPQLPNPFPSGSTDAANWAKNYPAVKRSCSIANFMEIRISSVDPNYTIYQCVSYTEPSYYFRVGSDVISNTTAPGSCPSGYKTSGDSCALDTSSSSSTPKPAGTPCQIIQTGSSFQLDPNNPACTNTDNPGTLKTADGSTINVGANGLNIVPPDYVPGKTGQPHTDVIPSGPGRFMVLDYQPQALGSPANLNPSLPYKTPIDLTRVTTIEPVNSVPTVTNITVSSGDTTPSTTGNVPAFPTITCVTVGTCDVAKDATLKGVATSTAQTAAAAGQIAAGIAATPAATEPNKPNIPDPDPSWLDKVIQPVISMDWLKNLFPQPNCTDPVYQIPMPTGSFPMTLQVCEYLPPIRQGMAYFWGVSTVIAIGFMFMKTNINGRVDGEDSA